MKLFLTAVLIILSPAAISGIDVLLEGYAPGAAGKQIHVFKLPDPVRGKKVLIDRLRVDINDKFNIRKT
ncbi:MAG TPA: hypothetical protein ENH59_06975 [Bacteroidetes bacterium]|nr:hypothetical protein [Bacteroidota bacterium]